MRQDSSHGEVSVALAAGQSAGVGTASSDTIALPRLAPFGARFSFPRPSLATLRLTGILALTALMTSTVAIVLVATASPSILVPRSSTSFPQWMSGPLHGLLGGLAATGATLNPGLSLVVILMGVAYCVTLAAVQTLSTRLIVGCVIALHALLLLAPPLQLEDVFNYLGYARLGALHGLNPYTHVIAHAAHDPVFRFTTWHHLRSPYGPLFTAATYPLAFLPIGVAYWLLKIATVLASLTFLWLVWFCARRLGRDPRLVLAFVALNPVYLVYAVGGFHNDFFMLVPLMAAIAFVLTRRDRAAGAALMVAIAVKFTAGLLLPFLLLAVPSVRRRLKVVAGAALAAVPLVVMTIVLFGFSLPNLSDQTSLLTALSVPNLVGDALGAGGGAPWLLHLGDVALALSILWLLLRHRDWVSGFGWATLALLATLAWLMPWYIVWVLPLAALGTSGRLRRATLAMTAFLVLTFVPSTGILLYDHGVNTLGGKAGQNSSARQRALEF